MIIITYTVLGRHSSKNDNSKFLSSLLVSYSPPRIAADFLASVSIFSAIDGHHRVPSSIIGARSPKNTRWLHGGRRNPVMAVRAGKL